MRHALLVAVLALLAVDTAGAEDATARTYPLPKQGSFELKVPVSWKDTLRQPPNDLPPTLTFSPNSGAAFQVLITPIWKVNQDMQMPGPEEMKSSVERAADGASQQAVEKTIPIRELKGSSGKGYYFSATDKAPKPDEFKYLTQGMLGVGDLAVTFTILTNDGQDAVVKEALSMLSSAAHK